MMISQSDSSTGATKLPHLGAASALQGMDQMMAPVEYTPEGKLLGYYSLDGGYHETIISTTRIYDAYIYIYIHTDICIYIYVYIYIYIYIDR